MLMDEIADIEDIKVLVNRFYDRVREDELLGPIFNEVIRDRWPEHLEKMHRFWQTVLLGEHTYHGSPFPPHARLPLEKQHFERWLELFNSTVEEHFEGTIAEEAKWRANKMADMFHHKIEYYKGSSEKPLIP